MIFVIPNISNIFKKGLRKEFTQQGLGVKEVRNDPSPEFRPICPSPASLLFKEAN